MILKDVAQRLSFLIISLILNDLALGIVHDGREQFFNPRAAELKISFLVHFCKKKCACTQKNRCRFLNEVVNF